MFSQEKKKLTQSTNFRISGEVMNKKDTLGIFGGCYWSSALATNRECLVCAHYTGAREFVKSKRYIRKLSEGKCALGCLQRDCQKFEIMPELKAENMTILEKVYARKYSRIYLEKVVKEYYNAPNAKFNYNNFYAGKLANIIAWYQHNQNPNNR